MSVQANPYAPPKAHVQDVSQFSSEAEEVRQEHIKHEASVRSIGILYYLGGFFVVLGAVSLMLPLMSKAESLGSGLIIGPIYIVLGVVSVIVGRGLRALKPWARTTSIVFAFIGLLGFPIGTLINGYILYLLLSEKGKRIFQPDYPEIVSATPHIKYRTSMVVWIVLGILVLGFAAAILIPMLSR